MAMIRWSYECHSQIQLVVGIVTGPQRNTSTNLHRYIVHEYVRRTTSGKACWFLKEAPRCLFKIKPLGIQASVGRILYALFVGPIEDGVAVSPREGCGTKRCINPYHQKPEKASFQAKAIDLDPYMEVLDAAYAPKELRKFEPLPPGVSVRQVHLCRHLHRDGKTLEQLQSYAQLSSAQVYKVIGGKYDDQIKKYEKQFTPVAARSSESVDEVRKEMLSGHHRGPIALPSDRIRSDDQSMSLASMDIPVTHDFGAMVRDPGPVPTRQETEQPPDHGMDVDVGPDIEEDSDEAAWLASLRGN